MNSPDQLKRLHQDAMTLKVAGELVRSPLNIRLPIMVRMMADLLRIHDQLLTKINELDSFIKSKKGDKGDAPTSAELVALIEPLIPEVADGQTPTEEDLLSLIRPLISQELSDEKLLKVIRPLIPTVTNGIDGQTPTEAELTALIKKHLPKGRDGQTPQKYVDYFTDEDIATIAKKVAENIKPAELDGEQLLHLFTKLPKGKKLGIAHVDGLEQTLSAFRNQLARGYLHGGGGSSSSSQTPTSGVIDGSNLNFTFATAPTIIFRDGVALQKTASDGTANWTGTKSITLVIAPTFDLFGMG